jgi:carbamoyltransferase
MYILGFTGGFDRAYDSHYAFPIDFAHDAAAVLVRDGEIVAGIEEERLNRIKHTNKAPANAIRFCLDEAGIELSEVDYLAYYATEEFLNEFFLRLHLEQPRLGTFPGIRTILQDIFERDFGFRPDADRFRFVSHHMAHAVSSFALCGFEDCLVLSMDGVGESVSTMVLDGRGKSLNLLAAKPQHFSLGNYYTKVIGFLGYRIYDEYKVMGLAPYGDGGRFRNLFRSFYALLPDGEYVIYNDRVLRLYEVLSPRQRGEPFDQIHKDIAAALQESLEAIVFHMLRYYVELTGHEYLAISGGVGQNSSMIGKIWNSGMFRDIFVQPAADDAGCAIGCALAVAHEMNPTLPKARLRHTFWGPDIGSDDCLRRTLEGWSEFVQFRKMENPFAETARLLAGGAVAGWVQGRTEYGPRALGNRSIVADPRPSENKHIINAMIKKREAYRPFAPSVLEEAVDEFFETPPEQKQFPFMSCVLNVREPWRGILGAITHIDGTSRLQTVNRETNPRYYSLIQAFGEITGVPIVLNTSFNNNVEPIVNTADEAVTCFLTSGLHYLVLGDYLVWKREIHSAPLACFRLLLSPCTRLVASHAFVDDSRRETRYELVRNYDGTRRRSISEEAHRVVAACGAHRLGEVMADCGTGPENRQLMDELFDLWSDRYVLVRPMESAQSMEV